MSERDPGFRGRSRREVIIFGGFGGAAVLAVSALERSRWYQIAEWAFSKEESEVISGLETFGDENALDQPQHDFLVDRFNRDHGNGFNPKEFNTIYATEYVREESYPNIPRYTGDPDYQTYVLRLNGILGRMLAEADPQWLGGGLETRRLMVLEAGVEGLASFHLGFLGWLNGGIRDSDGTAGIWDEVPSDDHTQPPFWDSINRVNHRFAHEKGHFFLHASDTYPKNVDFTQTGVNLDRIALQMMRQEGAFLQVALGLSSERIAAIEQKWHEPGAEMMPEAVHPAFKDVPPEWQAYNLGFRHDDHRDVGLMSGSDLVLSPYTAWLIARRAVQGWLHNTDRAIPEGAWNYPYEVPAVNILNFGEDYNGARVQIWRTSGTYEQRHLGELPIFDGYVVDGELNIGNPFVGVQKTDRGLVPVHECLLFVRVKKPNESLEWRWLELGDDFSVPLGRDNYPAGLRWSFNLADEGVNPHHFKWEITHEPIEPENYRLWLPLILNSGTSKLIPRPLRDRRLDQLERALHLGRKPELTGPFAQSFRAVYQGSAKGLARGQLV